MPRTDSSQPGETPAADAAKAPEAAQTAAPAPAQAVKPPSPLDVLIKRHQAGEIGDAEFSAGVADLAPKPAPTVVNPTPSAAAQQVAPNVVVNLPAAPTVVDEYYTLPWEDKVVHEDGDQVEFIDDPAKPGKKLARRYFVQRGVGLHVRTCKAIVAADGKSAQPADGRATLPFGPGKPGCFGFTTLQP